MDDETNLEAQEAPEVEALPEVEDTETEAKEPELDEDGNPIEEADPEPEEDFAEIVKDGKAYKVPAALKDEILMHVDYTRKTQELADTRRQVEATLAQVQQVTQAEIQSAAAISAIDAQIADFNSIDWDTWEETDPMAAQRAWRQFQQVKDARLNAIAQYQQASQQRTFVQQQETARLIEQGQRELAAKIPGWGQEKAQALQNHAMQSYGFSYEELTGFDRNTGRKIGPGIVDHRMIQVLHDAYQFRQASKKQQVARKVEVQQSVKPAAKVTTGNAPPRGLDDRLSVDEWAKRFNERRAKR